MLHLLAIQSGCHGRNKTLRLVDIDKEKLIRRTNPLLCAVLCCAVCYINRVPTNYVICMHFTVRHFHFPLTSLTAFYFHSICPKSIDIFKHLNCFESNMRAYWSNFALSEESGEFVANRWESKQKAVQKSKALTGAHDSAMCLWME